MAKISTFTAAVLALVPAATSPADAPAVLQVASFSALEQAAGPPPGWRPLTFDFVERHTEYTLVEDAGTVVIRAHARAGGSGLLRKIRIDPKEYPIVRWRWKVANVLDRADITRKEGDDAPARLLVFFEYDPEKAPLWEKTLYAAARILYGEYPPHSGISYLWESKRPIGSAIANPYADQVKMIVVETGTVRANQWVEEERNVYADYRAVFGKEPPAIGSVAIMTDTDVTGETATAYYGDIVFARAAP